MNRTRLSTFLVFACSVFTSMQASADEVKRPKPGQIVLTGAVAATGCLLGGVLDATATGNAYEAIQNRRDPTGVNRRDFDGVMQAAAGGLISCGLLGGALGAAVFTISQRPRREFITLRLTPMRRGATVGFTWRF